MIDLGKDLQSFAELRQLPHPPVIEAAFDRFDAVEFALLPRQVIHNDIQPHHRGNGLCLTSWVAGRRQITVTPTHMKM